MPDEAGRCLGISVPDCAWLRKLAKDRETLADNAATTHRDTLDAAGTRPTGSHRGADHGS